MLPSSSSPTTSPSKVSKETKTIKQTVTAGAPSNLHEASLELLAKPIKSDPLAVGGLSSLKSLVSVKCKSALKLPSLSMKSVESKRINTFKSNFSSRAPKSKSKSGIMPKFKSKSNNYSSENKVIDNIVTIETVPTEMIQTSSTEIVKFEANPSVTRK